MSIAGIIKVSAACPIFDGTEYPYSKNKMHMHLEAIDVDLWYVVKNGVPKDGEGVTAANVKKFVQLDSTAKNIIGGHLTKGQYGRVSALETSKLVWDWLSRSMKAPQPREIRESVSFATSSTASSEMTMRMSSSHLTDSLTSQMSFKPSAQLRSPSMKSSRHY